MEYVLEVKNVTKIFKNNRGVQDVSFNIKKGDVFGLLGPNGSGKTTTMKIITGLLKAKSGTVKIFDSDILENHEKCLAQVGGFIEAPSLIGYISEQKNMELAAKYYNCSTEKIDEILDTVGMLQYKKEKPEKFSLGMKQRLGIALALIGNPKLLVLDEPANGLDIEGMVEIRKIILKLKETFGTSFLISSHLASEIEKTCTDVGIMYQGQFITQAKMSQVIENYPSLEEYFLSTVKNCNEV